MGKGDRKTKKGKISKGTYGVSRPRPSGTSFKKDEVSKKETKSTAKTTKKAAPKKKAASKKE